MEDQESCELEVRKVQAEKNQLKKIIEGLNTQLKNVKDELEGTKKKLKKAEYERDNADSYVTNLKQEIATLNKDLYEERQRRKEDQKIRQQTKGDETPETDGCVLAQDSIKDENKDLKSVLEEAASAAMTRSGLVYDDRTGLYYDWNSGLYYDPNSCLYYNNKTGTYYYYDESSGKYEFHSQVDLDQTTKSNGENTDKDSTTENKISANSKELRKTKTSRQKGLPVDKDDAKHGGDNNDDDHDDEYSSGEIVDSDDSDEDDDKASTDEEIPPVPTVAPCIRAVVTKSSKLKIGTLFIVPCTGGTLGREKNAGNLIRIPDLEISKHHCQIKYDGERRQYFICDLASRNGSFLNGNRLSESQEQSEAHVLTHGDMLTAGGTTFLLHIHPGTETCYECEPGQVQAMNSTDDVSIIGVVQPAKTENSRKKQLKMLKRAYGLEKEAFCEQDDAGDAKGKYKNRAHLRRVKIGSDLPNVPDAPPASVHRPINFDNKGRKMLEKMGWKTGEGLGKEGAGRTEPVLANIRESKKGLGGGVKRSLDEGSQSSRSSSFLRAKTKQRYEQIVRSSNDTSSGAPQKRPAFVSSQTSHSQLIHQAQTLVSSVDKDVDMFAE